MLIAALSHTHWYASTDFLTVLGILATVLVGVLTAWISYIVATPRYQLYYSLPLHTSLLAASTNAARKDIKIFHLDKELQDPHILKVRLISRSRGDIPSSAFDQERPVILDIGIPIVAMLPPDGEVGRLPKIEYDGSALKVGPDLIGKRQEMVFTVLADGSDAKLSCESHLVNVRVRKQPSADRIPYPAIPAIAVPVIAGVWIAVISIRGNYKLSSPIGLLPPILWVIALIFVLLTARLSARRYPK